MERFGLCRRFRYEQKVKSMNKKEFEALLERYREAYVVANKKDFPFKDLQLVNGHVIGEGKFWQTVTASEFKGFVEAMEVRAKNMKVSTNGQPHKLSTEFLLDAMSKTGFTDTFICEVAGISNGSFRQQKFKGKLTDSQKTNIVLALEKLYSDLGEVVNQLNGVK